MDEWQRIQDLFEEGRLLSESQKLKLLAAEPNPSICNEVQALWENDQDDDILNFEQIPNLSMSLLINHCKEVPTPEFIGQYQIIEQISNTPNAVVFKAQQKEPITRTVAIKVLNHIFNNTASEFRFREEQRVLARLTHPHIATIFDSGINENGHQYYVMEYLEGLPITQYCTQHKLNLRARLALFQQVAEAIHHAHQKGIIHRDLKPANILVTTIDGLPVPKIIDFGIAKIKDTEDVSSMFQTTIGMIMGTPAYMSPEQASGNTLEACDLRTDVYAMGSLLYELCTGTAPLASQIKSAGSMRSIAQIIEEQRPLAPSKYLKSQDPALAKKLSGELDAICLKALEKRPTDRYQSCYEFAQDLKAFLNGQAISAEVPGYWYLLRKTLGQYRKTLATVASLFLIILVSLGITSHALIRATQAEKDLSVSYQRMVAVSDFFNNVFSLVEPKYQGPTITGRELLDIAAQNIPQEYMLDPAIKLSILKVLGQSYKGLGEYTKAYDYFQQANGLFSHLEEPQPQFQQELMNQLAFAAYHIGDLDQAAHLFQQVLHQEHLIENERFVANSGYALVLNELGKTDLARSQFQQLISEPKPNIKSDLYEACLNNYANLLVNHGSPEEAEQIYRQLLRLRTQHFKKEHPLVLKTKHNIAYALEKQGRKTEARDHYAQLIIESKDTFESDHPSRLLTLNNYALIMPATDRKKAISLLESVAAKDKWLNNRQNKMLLRTAHNLGDLYIQDNQLDKAIPLLQFTLTARTELLGEHDLKTLKTHCTLAEAFQKNGENAKADQYFASLVQKAEQNHGQSNVDTVLYRGLYAHHRCVNGDKTMFAELKEAYTALKNRNHVYANYLEPLLRQCRP